MYEAAVTSAWSFSLPLFCPSCHKLWGPPAQNLHPAPFQMCFYRPLWATDSTEIQQALSTCSGLLTPLLKGDSTREKNNWWQVFIFSSCLQRMRCFVTSPLTSFVFSCPLRVLLHSFSSVYFYIFFDLRTTVWSPITMSSCAVIYSSINISPLVWLWDQGGYSSCSSTRNTTLASIKHIKKSQRKHHTVQRWWVRPPNWKL